MNSNCSLFPPKTAAIILLLLVLLPSPLIGKELGRMFYTPLERKQMTTNPSDQNGQQAIPDTFMVNGMIQRGNGKRSLWINGSLHREINSKTGSPDSVTLPGHTSSIQLKVGQRTSADAPDTASGTQVNKP